MGMSTTIEDMSPQTSFITATNVFYMLLVPTLALWYVYWKLSRRHMLELVENIPGPPGWPIIGNAFQTLGNHHDIFKNLLEKAGDYKNIAKFWLGPRLLIFLSNPDDVELILGSQVHIDKSREYRLFEPWFGNGLLISTGQKWRSHRRLIAPTFHLNVLKTFIDRFNYNTRLMVDNFRKEGDNTFDVHDYMMACTAEILQETVMGVSRKKTPTENCFEYATAVMKMCDILHLRHTKIWLRPSIIFNMTSYATAQKQLLNTIHGLTRKVIKVKKEELAKGTRPTSASIIQETLKKEEEALAKEKERKLIEGNNSNMSYGQASGLKDDLDVDDDIGEKKRLAFLDLLLESSQNGVVITESEIKEQVDTIMFEGHDTTAAASSFFLCMMGVHSDIQKKVHEELDGIFHGSDRPITFQDTLEMKYLERCLMETLRVYPPVPLIARELKEDLRLKSCDHVIPVGCTVVIATLLIHKRPELYPDPLVFNPDNFLPEKCANRHYYGFIPFSAGPRSCVGRKYAMLKLKILLADLMRNFNVYSDMHSDDFKLQADVILKREEGFPIRVAPRKKVATAA